MPSLTHRARHLSRRWKMAHGAQSWWRESFGWMHCNLSLTMAQHRVARRRHPICPKPASNPPLTGPILGSTNERPTYCWSTFQWSLPTHKPALFPPHSNMELPFKTAVNSQKRRQSQGHPTLRKGLRVRIPEQRQCRQNRQCRKQKKTSTAIAIKF